MAFRSTYLTFTWYATLNYALEHNMIALWIRTFIVSTSVSIVIIKTSVFAAKKSLFVCANLFYVKLCLMSWLSRPLFVLFNSIVWFYFWCLNLNNHFAWSLISVYAEKQRKLQRLFFIMLMAYDIINTKRLVILTLLSLRMLFKDAFANYVSNQKGCLCWYLLPSRSNTDWTFLSWCYG